MGAFFAGLNSSGVVFDSKSGRKLLNALSHYGLGHSEVRFSDCAAAGLHSSRLQSDGVIRETNAIVLSQPRESELFAFEGRIDNRLILIETLLAVDDSRFDKSLLTEPCNLSDAELLYEWVSLFREDRLNDVIGPFVFVLINTHKRTAIAARDAMGSRALSYYAEKDRVCFATDESAFSGFDSFKSKFNEAKVARQLLMVMDEEPESFFNQAKTVRPGEVISVYHGQLSKRRFYRPRFDASIYTRSLAENAQQFRVLFDQAVKRRLSSNSVNGLMLSGGLDSSPIAVSMSTQCSELSSVPVALSWTFPETPEADETHLSTPLCQSLKMQQVCINCDTVSPSLRDGFCVDPRFPFSTPFVAYQQATLELARAEKIPTILSGMHGDILYAGARDVVYRALAKGRLVTAVKEFLSLSKLTGSKLRAFKRYILLPISLVAQLSRKFPSVNPRINQMLNDSLASSLKVKTHWLVQESKIFPRPEQYQKLFDGFAGEDIMLAKFVEAPYGVERRYPLRDRELCEFVLSVPSEHLYHLGNVRVLLKESFKDSLPSNIAQRNDKTTFVQPVLKQIANDASLSEWLDRPPQEWKKYVKECYFDDPNVNYELRQLALWRCAYYTFWNKTK